jgi:hypothetical protein
MIGRKRTSNNESSNGREFINERLNENLTKNPSERKISENNISERKIIKNQNQSFLSPIKKKRMNNQPNRPGKIKLERQKSVIISNENAKLSEKIIMLIKELKLSNNEELLYNNKLTETEKIIMWLAVYKKNNNSISYNKYQYTPVFQYNDLNFNSIKISQKENTIFSGAQANVYTNIKNNKNNPLHIVIKKFKIKTQDNRIETILLPELYGALMNLYIQKNLNIEGQKYFNKILGIYVVKKSMEMSTLQLVLEKCNGGDLISFFGNLDIVNMNNKCEIFHKLCYDSVSMLYLLKELKLVHLDIKPDNILFEKNQFKLGDFSTIKHYNTELSNICGTDIYISPLFIVDSQKKGIDLRKEKIFAKYLYDMYSMALSLFTIFITLFQIPIPPKITKYFPFTDEESTFKSKYNIWSNEVKYKYQVTYLEYIINMSFAFISEQIDLKKENLKKENEIKLTNDIRIIKFLFLSNDPFAKNNMAEYTYGLIKKYLEVIYLPVI